MLKSNFSCIIPFYNESEQLLSVFESVSKVELIDQIIFVDDGSTNNISEIIPKSKNIELIRKNKNQGKSSAVKSGLEKSKNENIVMLDADFRDLTSTELKKDLEQCINSNLDMLLIEVRGGNNGLDRLLRKEILFTGYRMLKKKDLEEVFKTNPIGYQLEVAINEYMIKNNKNVAWMKSNVLNIHKSQKWGIWKGLIKSFQMEISILTYLGPVRFLKQVLFFAKKNVNDVI